MSNTELSHYDLRALAEAIRLYEIKHGFLDDTEAVARSLQDKPEPEARIVSRAFYLATQHGWASGSAHTREKPLVSPTTVLVFVSIFAGILIGRGIGSGAPGPINALGWILGILLAQLVGVTAWFVSFRYQNSGAQSLFTLIEQGMSRWLSGKHFDFAHWQARAVLDQRHAIARWRVGMTVHGAWIALSAGMLGTVFMVLALNRIEPVLESTILNDRFFVFVVNSLGTLPSYLGFPLPSEADIRQALQGIPSDDITRSIWGWWIIGVLMVWVLSPRVVLWLTCRSLVRKRETGVKLDLEDTYYSRLRPRLFPPSEKPKIVDPGPDGRSSPPQGGDGKKECKGDPLVIGLDITDRPWPPPLPYPVRDGGVIHDLRDQQRIRERLDLERPARLLIACNADVSPDRSALKLIRDYAARSGTAAVWLIQCRKDGDGDRIDVWRSEILSSRIEIDRTFTDEGEALRWLETR